MRELSPLHRVLLADRPASHIVCPDGADSICWSEFFDAVARRAAALASHPAQRWLLQETTLYRFACGFFALLHANKEVVIPPNMQVGSIARLHFEERFDTVFDYDFCGSAPAFLAPINRAAPLIHLYTSGSTGEPKQVSKALMQFEAEIEVLESLWGKDIDAACVLATVPHHHIYGLLFRLLWPLAAGRAFDTIQCAEPDTLMERLRRFPDSVLVASPAQLSRLPDLVTLAEMHPRPKLVFSSGGPLQRITAATFATDWGSEPIEVYGSTETGGIAWRRQSEHASWTPLPGVEVQRGTDSALLLRSPFLPDVEWCRTEDAIDLRADQNFILRGRIDRTVKIEEKRLSLPEMEACLAAHEWVVESALLALQSRRQYIAAAIVLNATGRQILATEGYKTVIRALRMHLSLHYDNLLLPRRWRFVAHLPLNERGKLSQTALSALFFGDADAAVAA